MQSKHDRDAMVEPMASLGFGVLHAGVAVFAIYVLCDRDLYSQLFTIAAKISSFHPIKSILIVAMGVAALGLTLGLAVYGLGTTYRRWRRHEPEPEVLLRLRGLAYFAMACVLINAFLLSTPESFSGPFRLRFPVMGSATAILAFGAFALWQLQLPRIRRVVPAGGRRGVDLIAWNLVLTLIFAECGLRMLTLFWGSPMLVTESMPSQVRRGANRLAPGADWFGSPINAGGHYDCEFVPKSDGSGPLVVSVGDSFSYGYVPHPYHFTTIAERQMPGVEIYNMGFSGIGPTDYRYLIETEAVPLNPDLIVVQLYIGNDLTEGLALAGPSRWYDADSYLLAILWHRMKILRCAEFSQDDAVTEATTNDANLAVTYPFLDNPMLESPSLGAEAFSLLIKSDVESICVPNEQLYQRFFGWIEEIVQAAGDVPVKFVLIPHEFQVEDHLWEEILQGTDSPLDRELPQRTIVAWMEGRGLPVFDLLPLLRTVEPMYDGCRHVYHARNLHFNARGNEIAGQALARFVGPFPQAPQAPPTFDHDITRRWFAERGWPLTADEQLLSQVSTPEAIQILKRFGEIVSKNTLDGSFVLDAGLLSHPKDVIRNAATRVIQAVSGDEARFARDALPTLAFFQPGVGNAPCAIDSTAPAGKPWRTIVESEMAEIVTGMPQ